MMVRRFLAVLALALACAVPAWAQHAPVRTLEIRDGRVFVDGAAMQPEAVPAGLSLEGLSLHFQFAGDVAPVLTLNGGAYVLDHDRLVPFDPASLETTASAYGMAQPLGQSAKPASGRERTTADAPTRTRLDPRDAEAAYLDALSDRDRALYEQLRAERATDAEIARLAHQYRNAASDQRPALRLRLTEQLEAAFDLKLAIREAELDRAVEQLEAARTQLRERRLHRALIVERRLQELTGGG
jgi:hypothetical protein